MFSKYALCLFGAVITWLAGPAAAGQEGLAARLPEDSTLLCVHVDLGRTLEQARQNALFIDENAGQRLVFQVERLYGLLEELGARYEFRPQLFDRIEDAHAFLVVMRRDEPAVRMRKGWVPKFDPKTGRALEDEHYTQLFREASYFRPSLVVQTDEETATDFIRQFKAFFHLISGRAPSDERPRRRRIEMEQGELIGIEGFSLTVGRLQGYVIVSADTPVELWRALMAPPEKTVSDTVVHQILRQGDEPPRLSGLWNLGCLFDAAEDNLRADLEHTRAEYEKHRSHDSPSGWNSWRFAYGKAKRSLDAFRAVKRLLSLDRLHWLGCTVEGDVEHTTATGRMRLILTHDRPISDLLRELLNGSGQFAVPGFVSPDGAAVMGRVSLQRILGELEGTPLGLRAQDGPLKALVGVRLAETSAALASDFYVFVTGEAPQQAGFPPGSAVLWGVKDPAAARQVLDQMVTDRAGPLVDKRTYQGKDVYCFGKGVADPDYYPDGGKSVAAAIIDRYLTVGSWEHVTAAFRRAGRQQEGGRRLAALAESNPRANLIVLLPAPFRKELVQEMSRYTRRHFSTYRRLLRRIRSFELKLEDTELERELKERLQSLVLAAEALQEKHRQVERPATVVTGRHEGDHYALEATSEVRR